MDAKILTIPVGDRLARVHLISLAEVKACVERDGFFVVDNAVILSAPPDDARLPSDVRSSIEEKVGNGQPAQHAVAGWEVDSGTASPDGVETMIVRTDGGVSFVLSAVTPEVIDTALRDRGPDGVHFRPDGIVVRDMTDSVIESALERAAYIGVEKVGLPNPAAQGQKPSADRPRMDATSTGNQSPTRLEDFARDVGVSLPTIEADEGFTLSAQVLPQPLPVLQTSRIVGIRHAHQYNESYPVELIDLYTDKETCRALGLLIFATLFHSEPATVRIDLTHETDERVLASMGADPWTTPRYLMIEYGHLNEEEVSPGRLWQKPTYFSHWPEEPHKHPWVYAGRTPPADPYDLPAANLTNLDRLTGPCDVRDTLAGFGSVQGTAALAELLLNISEPSVSQNEYALESEVGFRGVAPGSVELRLFLPGSIVWDSVLGE